MASPSFICFRYRMIPRRRSCFGIPYVHTYAIPKESAPLKLPTTHCLRTVLPYGLEYALLQSGISLSAPRLPKEPLQSLPPMLRSKSTYPI